MRSKTTRRCMCFMMFTKQHHRIFSNVDWIFDLDAVNTVEIRNRANPDTCFNNKMLISFFI
jgi:hypothetical protein